MSAAILRGDARNIPLAAGALTTYIGFVVAANIVTKTYGHPVWVAPHLNAVAGTYLIGFALVARNIAQDAAGRWPILAAIGVGAAISAVFAGPALAFASGAAFLAGELLDMCVYTPLRRCGWVRAVIPANLVGGVVDTLVFLSLAPGIPLNRVTVAGQLAGKLLWVTGGSVLLVTAWRVVRQRRVEAVA